MRFHDINLISFRSEMRWRVIPQSQAILRDSDPLYPGFSSEHDAPDSPPPPPRLSAPVRVDYPDYMTS